MKKVLSSGLFSFALLTGLASVGNLSAAVTVIDDFNYSSFTNDQTYWTRVQNAGSAFIASPGFAGIRSRNTANGYSAIVSPASDTRYNFFDAGFTVGVTELSLTSSTLALNEAYFRLALVSSVTRQFSGNDAITMRVRYNADGLGGVALFGYKLDQDSADAEVRIGSSTTSQSASFVNFTGTLSAASLSFNPISSVGSLFTIEYVASITTSVQTYSMTGTMLIDKTVWGTGNGFSALSIESKRNNGTAGTGTNDAQVTIGSVVYEASAIPEPSSFAALAGLGMLGAAVSRRRRQA